MAYFAYLIVLLLVFVSATMPAVIPFAYGVLAADRDGYGVLSFFNSIAPGYKLATRAILLVVTSVALARVALRWRAGNDKGERIASMACVYIVAVSLLKGYDLQRSLSVLVMTGIPIFLILKAFERDFDHSKSLVTRFVFVQVLLAFAVLSVPELEQIDGAIYKADEGYWVNEEASVNTELPDAETDKGRISRYGQFHNPNALGFYSVIGLLFGVGMTAARGFSIRQICGVVLTAMAVVCWLNALTRGPMLMLLLALVASMVLWGSRTQTVVLLKAIFVGAVGAGVITVGLLADYLILSSDSVSILSRVAGYLLGIEAFISNPLLGVGPNWDWGFDYPHFLPLAMAADFGLLGSLLVCWLVFVRPFASVTRAIALLRQRNAHGLFWLGLVGSVWGIALTNNFTAPVLFWSSVYLIDSWTNSTVLSSGRT